MKYRALDQNDDYFFGQRRRMFLTDREAVAQAIKTRLRLLQEEWWEDQSDGLPLFQRIIGTFGGEENLGGVDLLIQERILSTPGVVNIRRFERTFEKRRYTYTALVETEYGDVELSNQEVMA